VTGIFILILLIGLVVALYKPALRPMLGIFVLTLVLTYLASKVGLFLWGTRYLLIISPMFYLLLGIGLSALNKYGPIFKLLPAGIAIVLLFNQFYVGWPNEDRGEDFRPVIRQAQTLIESGEGIYVYYGARPAFLVYYSGSIDNVKIGRWFRDDPLPEKMDDIEPFLKAYPHFWFVASHMWENEGNAIVGELDRRCARLTLIRQPGALAAKYDCAGYK
jgi:hypothetical protein